MKFALSRLEITVVLAFFLTAAAASITSDGTALDESDLVSNPCQKKLISLTFDDGPHPYYTERIVEILKNHNIPATFFVVGKQVEKHPEILKAIASNGFEIGNHTYSHPNLTTLSLSKVLWELEKTRLLVKKYTNKSTYIFRPPGGQINSEIKNFVAGLGYRTILWDILPRDHEEVSSEVIFDRVISYVSGGGILLLHSGRIETLIALEKLIPHLLEQGFTFVSVSDYEKSRLN